MLLDLDAFFASVEQLDHPAWKGKPVIVGGDADKRGVVSTCSYEARKFGVHSAMPASTARKLCPQAIWVPGHFDRYREISRNVMEIMEHESPFLQQVSIDEAFLDITPTVYIRENPVEIAQRVHRNVAKLGITCSIGLGVSKSVAKVASDHDKPNGMTIVYPGREKAFLENLPIKSMSGIGPVARERLWKFGIRTLGDVARAEDDVLEIVFGKNASMMRARCQGADVDAVAGSDAAKSISNELSFAVDLTQRKDIEAAIATVTAKVGRRLRMGRLQASTITLKVKYGDRSTRTVQRRMAVPSDNEDDFILQLCTMLDEVWRPGVEVRLIGMAASRFGKEDPAQESLFALDEQDKANAAARDACSEARDGLRSATDRVRDRFGEDAVQYGRELRTKENLTGSSSKNSADYKSGSGADD